MKLANVAVALVMVCSGCASQRVRREASLVLQCNDSLEVRKNLEHDTWVAEGCGRQAFCSLPEVDKAEVQCAGGAEGRTPIAELGS